MAEERERVGESVERGVRAQKRREGCEKSVCCKLERETGKEKEHLLMS